MVIVIRRELCQDGPGRAGAEVPNAKQSTLDATSPLEPNTQDPKRHSPVRKVGILSADALREKRTPRAGSFASRKLLVVEMTIEAPYRQEKGYKSTPSISKITSQRLRRTRGVGFHSIDPHEITTSSREVTQTIDLFVRDASTERFHTRGRQHVCRLFAGPGIIWESGDPSRGLTPRNHIWMSRCRGGLCWSQPVKRLAKCCLTEFAPLPTTLTSSSQAVATPAAWHRFVMATCLDCKLAITLSSAAAKGNCPQGRLS
jgi:hypothetical protein